MGRTLRDALIALGIVFGVGSGAMLLAHVSPIDGFGALFDGALGNASELAETLLQTTALLFPALGIALAFRAGLFNIGAEGQIVLGGMTAGILGVALPLPGPLLIPVVLVAGACAGGLWGGLAGFLKARFGANEVISTLMLNTIAILLATYLIGGPFKQPGAGAAETPQLPPAAWLPVLVPNSRLSVSFLIALALAAALQYAFHRTVFGYELRAAGKAPEAARRAGIDLGSAEQRSSWGCCTGSTPDCRRATASSRSQWRWSVISNRSSSSSPRSVSAFCRAARSRCRPRRTFRATS
jgi:ABC-type uncharacterized transport system permease subunit